MIDGSCSEIREYGRWLAFHRNGTCGTPPIGHGARRSFFLGVLGDARMRAGRFAEGEAAVDEALAFVFERGERWYAAELHRLKGEFKLAGTEHEAAKCAFQRAFAIARHQQARSFELRAATSLARLWREQDSRQQAHDLLASIYGWFTEGFETADLKDANALLEELCR